MISFLRHNLIELALHELRAGEGRPLLFLHGLGEAIGSEVPSAGQDWPGPVYGLDFTGHGRSTVPIGGGYTAEMLLADVDVALGRLGPSTIVGRGLGAYIALLAAGARPTLVRGAVLTDGAGLSGGGPMPPSSLIAQPALVAPHRAPDPLALLEMARDVRPTDYATNFVHLAVQLSGLPEPIAVAAIVRPPWLAAVAAEPGVVTTSLPDAVALYATDVAHDRSFDERSASSRQEGRT